MAMEEQKKENGTSWLTHDDLMFRIKEVDQETSIIWVSMGFKDLCFSLTMHDFVSRCEEDLNLVMDIDATWNRHKGLLVKKSETKFVIGEIINFVKEWEVTPGENADVFAEEEWYS